MRASRGDLFFSVCSFLKETFKLVLNGGLVSLANTLNGSKLLKCDINQTLFIPERRPRNTRTTFHGTVLGSGVNDGHWRVYWDACQMTSEHTSNHLRWVSNPGANEEQKARMEALRRQMDIYIGTHRAMLDYTRTRGLTRRQNLIVNVNREEEQQQAPNQNQNVVPLPPPPQDQPPDQPQQQPDHNAEPNRPIIFEDNNTDEQDPDDVDDVDVLFDEREVEVEMREDEENGFLDQIQNTYLREKDELVASARQVLVKGPRHHETVWTVTGDIKENDVEPHVEFFKQTGVRGFDFSDANRTVDSSEFISESGKVQKNKHKSKRINFLELFRHLWGDDDGDEEMLDRMNGSRAAVEEQRKQNNARNSNVPIRIFTRRELWIGWGLILAGRYVGNERGEQMWRENGVSKVSVDLLIGSFDPNRFMKLKRFQEWKACVALAYADETLKNDDPWWQISSVFDKMRRNRQRNIAMSIFKVMDESMSAFSPQTTKSGNLPHLSFVKRKPEPLGTEIKTVMCCLLCMFLTMNVCRKKGDTAGEESEYTDVTHMKTCRVSLSLMKASKVDRTLTGDAAANAINPNATRDVFLGDAWFSSVELVVQAMKIHDSYYIGVIKTNSSKYPKKFIEETMQNWPAGTHLNLETVVEDVPIIATGYKYCKRKILCFIFTKGAGHTEPGKLYVAKWHDSKST